MELEIAGKTNQKDHFDIKKRANTASLHHQTQPMKKTPLLVLLFRHDHNKKEIDCYRVVVVEAGKRRRQVDKLLANPSTCEHSYIGIYVFRH